MNISTINELWCDYIYMSFKTLETAGKAMVDALCLVFDGVKDLLKIVQKYFLDVLQTMLDFATEVVNKIHTWVAEFYSNLTTSAFCKKYYNCSFIIEDLINPNSPFNVSLRKLLGYENENSFQTAIYCALKDYNNFKKTICSGLDFGFLVDMLKSLVDSAKSALGKAEAFLNRQYKRFLKLINGYEMMLLDMGVEDFLNKLRKYFNCILDGSAACAELDSAKSFFNYMISKLHLQMVTDNTYKLNADAIDEMTGIFRTPLNTISNLKKMLDSTVGSLDKILSNPGGLSALSIYDNIVGAWNAFEDGDFKVSRVPLLQKIRTDWNNIRNAFNLTIDSPDEDPFIRIEIDDINGTVTVIRTKLNPRNCEIEDEIISKTWNEIEGATIERVNDSILVPTDNRNTQLVMSDGIVQSSVSRAVDYINNPQLLEKDREDFSEVLNMVEKGKVAVKF